MHCISFSPKLWDTKILQNINLVVAVFVLRLYFFLILKKIHHTVKQIFIKFGFSSPPSREKYSVWFK